MPHFPHYTRFCIGLILFLGIILLPLAVVAQEDIVISPTIQTPSADSAAIQVVSVKMESYAYTPKDIFVQVGVPVKLNLSNDSFLVPHNFLLDDPQGNRLIDADISSGDTQALALIFEQPGEYRFYCDKQLLFFPTHREQGMEGRMIVQ